MKTQVVKIIMGKNEYTNKRKGWKMMMRMMDFEMNTHFTAHFYPMEEET